MSKRTLPVNDSVVNYGLYPLPFKMQVWECFFDGFKITLYGVK